MDKTRRPLRIFGVLTALFAAALLAGLFLWVPTWPARLVMAGLLLAAGLCCLAAFTAVRRSLVAYTDALASAVDDLVEGKPLRLDLTTTDTLAGKIQLKLRRLYEITRQQAERNQEEKEAIQGLVSDISHQVKTPTATIKMYCGILRERPVKPQQQAEFLAAIDSQTDKLDFLMGAMVKMSRLETGVIHVTPRKADLYDTAEEALTSVAAEAAFKNITLVNEIKAGFAARHDPKWTAEAIVNLLNNAIKYTPEGGVVRLTAQHREFFTRLTVSDTGPGVPEAAQPKVFQRFYRDVSAENEEGIGIGLYLVREIMTLQGGSAEVRSEGGKGADFTLSFPN